jgi:hypothetical protein
VKLIMKPSQIDDIYISALREAATVRKRNIEMDINQLIQMTPFSGFVAAAFLKGLNASMFICNNDDGVDLRCFWNGHFEPMTMALWAVLSKDANCILDVGVHSGIYSIIAQAANLTSAVISIEP